MFFEGNTAAGVFVETFGNEPNAGEGGSINIEAGGDLTLSDGTLVKASTAGSGLGGDVTLHAFDDLVITGQNNEGARTATVVNTSGLGNAGKLVLRAGEMSLTEGAVIWTGGFGTGASGEVTIDVQGNVELSGVGHIDGEPSQISTTSLIEAPGAGITVKAESVRMDHGGSFDTSSFGFDAGDIVFILSGDLEMTGESAGSGIATNITSSAVGEEGAAGEISITAENIELSGGANIKSEPRRGSASNIHIDVEKVLALRGTSSRGNPTKISTQSSSSAQIAGNIEIAAQQIDISSGAEVRAESIGVGEGGNVTIRARDLRLENSSMQASAIEANGGVIEVTVDHLVYLYKSNITASVDGGEGRGGNVFVDPNFVVLSQSNITAQAKEGQGGRIEIFSDYYIQSNDSRLDATANPGVDGTVIVEASLEDISKQLAEVQVEYLDTSEVFLIRCADRAGGDVIGLSTVRYEVLPESPYGLRADTLGEHLEYDESRSHGGSPDDSDAALNQLRLSCESRQ